MCSADRRGCGLRLLRTEGYVSRRVNVMAACDTEKTRTTNSVVRATLAEASKDRIIATLKLRVRSLEEKNRELTQQIEVAYGKLCSLAPR